MKISVILCTFNRADRLGEALASLAMSMKSVWAECEVLVVDNNSTDNTRALVTEFSRRFAEPIHYVFEARQGKSFALNRGIAESTGDILAFMDDDVTVEPEWLNELTSPLADPQWCGTGGRIFLPNGFVPPEWLKLEGPYALGPVLALFDLGSEARPLTQPPVGTNMAFRKEVFTRYGTFRTDLGPRPGSELRFEDTEFGARVLAGGEKLLYVPAAIVRHAVADRRLKKSYYLRYFFDYGRGMIREKAGHSGADPLSKSILRLGHRLVNILPSRVWNWLREHEPQRRFFEKCLVWRTLGEISELGTSMVSGDSELQPKPTKL